MCIFLKLKNIEHSTKVKKELHFIKKFLKNEQIDTSNV